MKRAVPRRSAPLPGAVFVIFAVMNTSSVDRPFKTWKSWGALILFWHAVALIFLTQQYMFSLAAGRPMMTKDIIWTVAGWYPWIFMTPIVFELARRFPLTRRRWGTRLSLHSLFAVLVMLLEITIFTGVHWVRISITGAEFDLARYFRITILRSFLFDVLFYFILVVGYSFVRQLVVARERETELALVESTLVEAQLESLRSRLNPHFLFNTLHTIGSMMDEVPEAARRTISDLSDLLRHALATRRGHLVTLETELGFIDKYLRIERERFGDRLRITRNVAQEARQVMVPDMFLQPVVENAIRHAVAPFADGGGIEIAAHILQADGGRRMLRVSVADDGPGISGVDDDCTSIESLNVELGIGLQNTVERLGTLFRESNVSFCRSDDGGLEVRMDIPLDYDDTEAE